MRDFKGMKRQRGRNRGGGGGKPQHNTNRSFESNGPDVKVRGNAQTVFEKYQQLARDAGSAGDRVLAENYLQHAEHYFRVLRAMQPQRAPSDIMVRDQFSSGLDIDFEAEPDENDQSNDTESSDDNNNNDNNSQQGERRDNRQRDDRPRDDRQRDDRPRDDRQQRDDRPPRDDRQQGEGGGAGRGRRDRWRERDDRQGRFERGEQQQRDPMAVVEPQAQPLPAGEKSGASPVLRSASGDVSHAPAFLGAPRADADEAPPKPRRTRKPKAAPANEEA